MILFVSDMHFGREAASAEAEAALVACLRAAAPEVERLYLVGDVFDEFIEYRYLVPKGFVRFQALLAEWTDRGIPVTYLVGNHDPWHRDYFGRELGVRVVGEAITEPLQGSLVYMAHGDGIDPASRLYRRLRPVLRHPLPVALYEGLLPGDTGFRLARWYNRRFGHDAVQPSTVEALRAHARRVLDAGRARVVVMGHSHHAELHTWPEGLYLNTGAWLDARTYGCLDAGTLRLLRWNGSCSETLAAHRVS